MKTTRYQRQQLKKDNKKYTNKYVAIPKTAWPSNPNKLFKVLRNRNFLVQLYLEENNIVRLSICRTAVSGESWAENITWEELQEIKRAIGYGDYMAIEIFPPDIDIVNVANMRHLWVLEKPLSIGWKNNVI